MKILCISVFAFSLAITCLQAQTVKTHEQEEQSFASTVTVQGEPLELLGLGTARYKVMFKIYVAGLYLPAGSSASNVRDNISKRLEIAYLYDIKREDLVAAGDNFFKKMVSSEKLVQFQAQLDKVNGMYLSVKKGDRLALNYKPGRGLALERDGKEVGLVAGDEFAQAYLDVWLGDKPVSPGLLKQIKKGL